MQTLVLTTPALQKLLQMDPEELGEIVHRNAIEDEGSFKEIGRSLQTAIRNARDGRSNALKAVEETLIAMTGAGFDTTAGLTE